MNPFLLLLTLWWPGIGQAQTQPAVTSPAVPPPLVNYTDLRIDPAAMQVHTAHIINTAFDAANNRVPYRNGTAHFSLIAEEIFSLYIPQTIRPGLGVAIQSAAASANITGNINSLVTSAILAETPPTFLTAVPPQYQTDIARVGEALSSIRAGMRRISISSADHRNSISVKALNSSLQTVNSSILVSTTDSRGSNLVTVVPATVVNGTKVAVTPTSEISSTGNNVG